jgi:hypothetical protein
MSRAKHWTFTLNNYAEEDVNRLSNLHDDEPTVQYIIFGKEVGETGTPHLQGFVSYTEKQRLQHCVRTVGQSHFEVARCIPKAIAYCKKDGDYVEFGIAPRGQGASARNDLNAFIEAVKSRKVTTLKAAREKHPEVAARYANYVRDYISDNRYVSGVSFFPLRVWQAELYAELRLAPPDRTIRFIVDPVGNSGKSWFAQYCEQVFPSGHVQILAPTRKQDLAYALDTGIQVFFLDAPRCKNGEFIQYDFLEQLKDRRVFSSKYESCVKRLEPLHVVVLMNEDPNMEALSADRYSITRINAAMLACASVANVPVPGLHPVPETW